MKWITRERPKIDRIACPWLIQRFIDDAPNFRFVPANDVMAEARRSGAIPFDVPGAELRRIGPQCSFDAFLAKYRLDEPALHRLAVIVRGADSGQVDLAPQAAGLQAISFGLSRCFRHDSELLTQGFVLYDALYLWCRKVPPAEEISEPRIVPWPSARGLWESWRQRRSRARAGRALATFSDRMLRDIGLDRRDVEREL